ncbi:hypothetical protein Poli38472_012756 [Pythium oligandrum]|uniref:C3HC-type domain-containing protein n=1 Tax=Pythium oligandrum TaxID=41045 RepID=A0A8K1CEY1_PYTOL|nr:hypothetical protein Poli38472_012756 [Pythium oligandrum]|eukprot:TMW61565.1 hypothetical protein Poli38472_012756 [Pythium oligandrum]
MERMEDAVERTLARWRDVTTPLDHKAIDQDALMIASSSLTALVTSPRAKKAGSSSPTDFTSKQCRAWSHADFLQRLATYGIATWFAKPKAISPLVCARFGWVNTASDMLQCAHCEEYLCCAIDDKLSKDGVKAVAERFAGQLATSHADMCPWKSNPSPESFTVLPILSPHQVSDDITTRMEKLLKSLKPQSLLSSFDIAPEAVGKVLDAVDKEVVPDLMTLEGLVRARFPTHSVDTAVVLNAVLLTVFGWQLQSESGALSCEYCNRSLLLPTDKADTEDDEKETEGPPAKRQKTASSPSRPVVNPLAEHRWFCPWVIPQCRNASEQGRMRELLGLLADEQLPLSDQKLGEFVQLPGWTQYAQALKHLKHNAAASAPHPDSSTPEDALARIQSILGLPEYR